MERIVMNTESLQNNFPEVYRDFFARNDLVVSWCFSFPWTPSWIWNRDSYISIKSKVPLKCYVWFKLHKNIQSNFKNITYYDITKKNFETISYSKINKEHVNLISFISKFLNENNFDWWVNIEILSETSRWHSFWFNWTSSAIIAWWLFILTKNINYSHLEDYNNFIISSNFKKLDNLATIISIISKKWNSAWQNVKHTLHNNSDPSFLLIEKKQKKMDCDSLWNFKYSLIKIWEKCSENIISTDIPMDYYMIFSWMPTDSNQVLNFIKWNEKKFKNYSKIVNDFILWNEFQNINTIFSQYQKNDDFIYKILNENINILWIKMIEIFKNIFENWYDVNVIDDFIENINNYNNVVSLIERQSWFQDKMELIFKTNIHNNEEQIWILPAYSWKFWWWYVVVTKQWFSRETIKKTLDELKKNYTNVQIEYSSYEDGNSSDWIKLEQYISDGIYSKYIDKNKVIYKDNKWNSYLWDYNEIIKNYSDWVLFDKINNKIYFNWEKLTSKDILSQNTTIEIITKLMDNIWEEISNKNLPISSYSGNKNEMLWKIILPLLKFLESKTWEKLQIVCKWSITDFFIKMWEVNLRIWVISKI